MEVKGRQFDYSFGANLNYVPRSEAGISFAELRALADALPLLRAVIETRKDQIAAQNFTVRQRARAGLRDASARIDAALEFLSMPDRRHSFADWLRMLLEDVLVIDAATIFRPGRARAAQKLGEERARQGDPGVHGRTRSRVRMGGDDAIDPLQQARTLNILVSAGIKTREEARAELGLGREGKAGLDQGTAGLGKFNPYHNRQTGQFTAAADADVDAADPLKPKLIADQPLSTTQDGFKYDDEIHRQMGQRGWTPEQIDEAVRSGPRIDAINKRTGGPATRYAHAATGRSVVIDNSTNEVVQVGRDGFLYGEGSGDRPGAVMRPPPASGSPPESKGFGGGGGGGGGSDFFGPRTRVIPDEERPSD